MADDGELNSSRLKQSLAGRNMFDEDVDDQTFKNTFTKLKSEALENVETVGWDGTPLVSSEQSEVKSARMRTSAGSSTYADNRKTPVLSNSVSYSKGDVGGVQLSMPRSQSGNPSVRHTGSSASLHSVDSMSTQQRIADMVSWEKPKSSTSNDSLKSGTSEFHITESAKTEAIIQSLQREIQQLKHSTRSDMKPVDTITRILNGQSYVLEIYKSLEEKQELLRSAVEFHDGNAIITVILFLRDTLRDTLFFQQLQKHPEAVNHYINFLRITEESDKLIQLLSLLGRSEEAGMARYRQASSSPNIDNRVKAIQSCYSAHFVSVPSLSFEAGLVQQHIDLLQRQLPIDKADEDEQRRGRPIFKELPRASSVGGRSVITTLVYCCLYHYSEPETQFASPLAMRKLFKLSDKQFIISALCGRGRLKKWQDLDALFQTKSWFGGTKTNTAVSFEVVLRLLRRYDAPLEVVKKYCEKVNDLELRVNLAKKYECHTVALEAICQLRDRTMFEQYERTLVPNSPAWFYAEDLKKNPTIKWKS